MDQLKAPARTQAELLEMETTALASAIKRNIDSIQQIGRPPIQQQFSQELQKTWRSLVINSPHEGRRSARPTFTKRLSFAQLKRQIARDSKYPQRAAREERRTCRDQSPPAALEERVDQIAESLARAPE